MQRFRDRHEAGMRLARALEHLRGQDVLVLALPRGGVPVGFEVAKALGAELDVVVARKLGAPGQPEFGVGAIAPHARVIDRETIEVLGIAEEDLEAVERREREELERRAQSYQAGRPPPRVRGRTVVVVDDGVATGVTARAALRSVRAEGPARVIFAAPVGPPEARRDLSAEADEVILVETPSPFQAVGLWYEDFSQTEDDEVLALLAQARRTRAPLAREVRLPAAGAQIDGTLIIKWESIRLVQM